MHEAVILISQRTDFRGHYRSAKANAIDLRGKPRAERSFEAFRDDNDMRVTIVTGAGERFFSPGWDLKAAAAGEASEADWGPGGFGGLNHPRNLNKPMIAAVNGIACGGGFEIVLGTDIIVMEEHATLALPEINVGVLADAGSIKLRRRIPYHVAVELLLTGRWMDAKEALHWGLANHVVPKGQALTKAREIAQQLADGPPLLFPAIKQLLRHTEMVSEHEAFGCTTRSTSCSRVVQFRGPQGRHACLHRETQAALDRSLGRADGAAGQVQPPRGRSKAREMM